MLIGRTEELDALRNFYNREGSQIVVVYGQKGVGKSTLLRAFTEDKQSFSYYCREASEREQQYEWGRELGIKGVRTMRFPGWGELFSASVAEFNGKAVLIIDEFQHIIKSSTTFMQSLVTFVNDNWNKQEIMVVLVSSSSSWVENAMVGKIGEAAYELSGLLKIRPLDFFTTLEAFPGYSMEDSIFLYSVLGGVPGLWKHMNPDRNLKKNICEHFLSENGSLRYECERLLLSDLRELNVYNTILSAIAAGNQKLNDIFAHTEFSRAKISVYLKNLMELEIIEKVFSYDTDGKENAQKGVYRILNPLVHFTFTFLYPNLNRLEEMDPESFYNTCIKPYFRQYSAPYFKQVCLDYVLKRGNEDTLPFTLDRYGEWVGKAGNIDIILQDEEENTLLGMCSWSKPMLTYEEYEHLLFLAGKAKIKSDYIWLFAGGRFDEKLVLEAKVKKNLQLISLADLSHM